MKISAISILVLIGFFFSSCSSVTLPSTETQNISQSAQRSHTNADTSIAISPTSISNITPTKSSEVITETAAFKQENEYIKLNTLPSGRYIIYSIAQRNLDIFHYVVSETGQEMGQLSLGSNILTISPDQKFIAYTGLSTLEIYDVEKDQTKTIPIEDKSFWEGHGGLTWGPASDQLARAASASIKIISVIDGKNIGQISNMLHPQPGLRTDPINPNWSPNGEWIAYHILSGHMEFPPSPGPYITDTSCITNPMGCEEKTKLITNAGDQLIDWTPGNKLVVFDKYDKIQIYDVVSSSLIQEIQLPGPIGFAEFIAWSNDEEWIAFGGECGVCTMSIKTGEVRVLTENGFIVNFWYIVP